MVYETDHYKTTINTNNWYIIPNTQSIPVLTDFEMDYDVLFKSGVSNSQSGFQLNDNLFINLSPIDNILSIYEDNYHQKSVTINYDTWYHVVFTVNNGSATLKLFNENTLIDTITTSVNGGFEYLKYRVGWSRNAVTYLKEIKIKAL